MTKHQSFADIWAEVENDDVFWTEKNILDFTTKLFHLMEDKGISKKELAERLGTSQAYITKIFRGNANFTLASMTKLVRALDAKLDIQIVPKEEHVERWFKVLKVGGKERLVLSKTWQLKPIVEKSCISDNDLEAVGC